MKPQIASSRALTGECDGNERARQVPVRTARAAKARIAVIACSRTGSATRCGRVADRMIRLGRDKQLCARARMMNHAIDLEFHLALDDHDQLIDIVDIVGPDLPGQIYPQAA